MNKVWSPAGRISVTEVNISLKNTLKKTAVAMDKIIEKCTVALNQVNCIGSIPLTPNHAKPTAPPLLLFTPGAAKQKRDPTEVLKTNFRQPNSPTSCTKPAPRLALTSTHGCTLKQSNPVRRKDLGTIGGMLLASGPVSKLKGHARPEEAERAEEAAVDALLGVEKSWGPTQWWE
eukprot:381921-Pelagomonas_calceolata.AAC.1